MEGDIEDEREPKVIFIPLMAVLEGGVRLPLDPLLLRSVCFIRKSCAKIVFHIFQCLRASKKISQRKTIFSQHKNYDLFLEIVFHYFFFFWKITLFHNKLNIREVIKLF